MTASVDVPPLSRVAVGRQSVVHAAQEAGLVAHLTDGDPKTLPQLARSVQMKEDAVEHLVNELCALGLCTSKQLSSDSDNVGFLWCQPAPEFMAPPAGAGMRGDGMGEYGLPGMDNLPLPKQGPFPPYVHNYSVGWPPMVPYVQPPMYMYSMMPGHQPFYPQNAVFPTHNVHPAVDGRDLSSVASSSSMITPARPGGAYRGFQLPDARTNGNGGAGSTGWGGIPLQTQPLVPSSPTSGTAETPDADVSSDKDNSQKSSGDARAPCAFFLKTGTCAYGDRCKFDHPLDRVPVIRFNTIGLPVRPGEPDCSFYMKNLRCGFGASCKFNHPEPYLGWGIPPGAMPVPNSMMPWYGVPYANGVPPAIGPPNSGLPCVSHASGSVSPSVDSSSTRGGTQQHGGTQDSGEVTSVEAGKVVVEDAVPAPHLEELHGAPEQLPNGSRNGYRARRRNGNGKVDGSASRKDKPGFKSNGKKLSNGHAAGEAIMESLADSASSLTGRNASEASKPEAGSKVPCNATVAAH